MFNQLESPHTKNRNSSYIRFWHFLLQWCQTLEMLKELSLAEFRNLNCILVAWFCMKSKDNRFPLYEWKLICSQQRWFWMIQLSCMESRQDSRSSRQPTSPSSQHIVWLKCYLYWISMNFHSLLLCMSSKSYGHILKDLKLLLIVHLFENLFWDLIIHLTLNYIQELSTGRK